MAIRANVCPQALAEASGRYAVWSNPAVSSENAEPRRAPTDVGARTSPQVREGWPQAIALLAGGAGSGAVGWRVLMQRSGGEERSLFLVFTHNAFPRAGPDRRARQRILFRASKGRRIPMGAQSRRTQPPGRGCMSVRRSTGGVVATPARFQPKGIWVLGSEGASTSEVALRPADLGGAVEHDAQPATVPDGR